MRLNRADWPKRSQRRQDGQDGMEMWISQEKRPIVIIIGKFLIFRAGMRKIDHLFSMGVTAALGKVNKNCCIDRPIDRYLCQLLPGRELAGC